MEPCPKPSRRYEQARTASPHTIRQSLPRLPRLGGTPGRDAGEPKCHTPAVTWCMAKQSADPRIARLAARQAGRPARSPVRRRWPWA